MCVSCFGEAYKSAFERPISLQSKESIVASWDGDDEVAPGRRCHSQHKACTNLIMADMRIRIWNIKAETSSLSHWLWDVVILDSDEYWVEILYLPSSQYTAGFWNLIFWKKSWYKFPGGWKLYYSPTVCLDRAKAFGLYIGRLRIRTGKSSGIAGEVLNFH